MSSQGSSSMDSEARTQLARLTHQAGEATPVLTSMSLAEVHRFLDGRLPEVAAGLAAEAMASDDVQDAAAALAYLDDRLAFFGELLTASQRRRLQKAYQARTGDW